MLQLLDILTSLKPCAPPPCRYQTASGLRILVRSLCLGNHPSAFSKSRIVDLCSRVLSHHHLPPARACVSEASELSYASASNIIVFALDMCSKQDTFTHSYDLTAFAVGSLRDVSHDPPNPAIFPSTSNGISAAQQPPSTNICHPECQSTVHMVNSF